MEQRGWATRVDRESDAGRPHSRFACSTQLSVFGPVLFCTLYLDLSFGSGELRLQGGTGEVSGDLAKGNVFLDGHPVCDAGWSQEDARVACRW